MLKIYLRATRNLIRHCLLGQAKSIFQMMNLLNSVNDWFWSPSIWLPPGKSWKDLESTENRKMPNFEDLKLCSYYLPVVFILLRYAIIESFLLKPLGRRLGIKELSCQKAPSCNLLETVYLKHINKKVSRETIVAASKKLGWQERQVERWLRQKKAQERPTQMFKFCDSSWHLLYYSLYCIYGIYILHNKPWIWDMRECWKDYPFRDYDEDVFWYYMIPLGFYLASTLTFLYQHQRKDALQMFLHHLVTLMLIVTSWAVNLIKVGSTILLVHECADIPLLLTKLCGYVGRKELQNGSFIAFFILWIFTRLGLFPFWIMRQGVFVSYFLDEIYPVYYLINGLLVILLAFHVLWTVLIIKVLVRKFRYNEGKDVRSESEELSEKELFNSNEVAMSDAINSCASSYIHKKQS